MQYDKYDKEKRFKQSKAGKNGWEGKGKYFETWKRRSLKLEKDWDGKGR